MSCCSAPRGARVVAETEKQAPGVSAINLRASVVLPVPEGAESTSIKP